MHHKFGRGELKVLPLNIDFFCCANSEQYINICSKVQGKLKFPKFRDKSASPVLFWESRSLRGEGG